MILDKKGIYDDTYIMGIRSAKKNNLKLNGIKKQSKRLLKKDDNLENLKILKKMEAFSGTVDDARIMDSDYCLFVLGREKFETITYLRELFYGEEATTGRIQRVYKPS